MPPTYSIAFDIQAPDPATQFRDLAALLYATLRVAEDLPARDELFDLPGHDRRTLAGSHDLTVDWAAERAERAERNDGGLRAWALRISHPGRDDERLLWALELAGRAGAPGDRLTLGVRTSVEALAGGARPFDIVTARPSIVPAILERWPASRQDLPLCDRFLPLADIPRLRSRIADPARELPIVLLGPRVQRRSWSSRAPSRLQSLAQQLAGSACLAIAGTERELLQFNEGIDEALRLTDRDGGAIYWPIERGHARAQVGARREPFVVPSDDSVRHAASDLLRRLMEVALVADPGAFTSVDRLRARADERRRAMAEETADTIAQVAEKEIQELRARLAETHSALARALRERDDERRERLRLQHELRTLEIRSERRSPLDAWAPAAMTDVLVLVRSCPDLRERLVITDAAERGARRSDYKDPAFAWRGIVFLATRFLDAARAGQLGDAVEFAARHGFEVAMTESALTKDNEAWMKQRDVRVGSRTLRCIPHLKKGNGPSHECLRVHFAIDGTGAASKLVLGHVGGHLTTAMTAMQ